MALELWSAPCAVLEGGLNIPVLLPGDLEPRGSQAGAAVRKVWETLKCVVQL